MPLTAADLWRTDRAALGLLFLSGLGLFLSVFVAAATTPWFYGLTAVCWFASIRARQSILGTGDERRALARSGLLMLGGIVVAAFALALLLLPLLARIVP